LAYPHKYYILLDRKKTKTKKKRQRSSSIKCSDKIKKDTIFHAGKYKFNMKKLSLVFLLK